MVGSLAAVIDTRGVYDEQQCRAGLVPRLKDEMALLPVVGTLTPSVHFAGRLWD